MYLSQADACNVQSSTTPITPDQIAAAQASAAADDSQTNQLLANWLNLIDRTPAQFQQITDSLGMAPQAFVPTSTGSDLITGRNSPAAAIASGAACVPDVSAAPVIVPLNGPFLTAPEPVSLITPPLAPAPAAAPPGAGGCTRPPRSGNICQDLVSGAVYQSQVSFDQLVACAQAGWRGAAPSCPLGDNSYLGTVDLNPPPPGGAAGLGAVGARRRRRLVRSPVGLADGGGFSIGWALVGLTAISIYLFSDYWRRYVR